MLTACPHLETLRLLSPLLLTMPIRTRADLRCDGGGVLEERDDLRVPLLLEGVILGVFQRRVAILPTGKRGERRRWRRPPRRERAAAVGGAEGRRGAYAGPLPPKPHPRHPRPQAPLSLPPRPSAPSRTLSLRRASAPALSSASTQGASPAKAAMCSAVLLICRDAAAAAHTRVSGGGGRAGGAWRRRARGGGGLGGRQAGRRSRCLWRRAWHPW